MDKRSRGKVTAEQRVALLFKALDDKGAQLNRTAQVVLAISYAVADDDGAFTDAEIKQAMRDPGMVWAADQLISEWEQSR